MARKFGPRQLKREPSPGFWPIHRKEYTWAPRTRPGPHPREKSLPLVVIVRESLGLLRALLCGFPLSHCKSTSVRGKSSVTVCLADTLAREQAIPEEGVDRHRQP